MRVLNIHQRELKAAKASVGALIDSLATSEDGLWPRHIWPPMVLDRPMAVGASGGHGPIRYVVEEYLPGSSVKFQFNGPKGFDGFHKFEAIASPTRPVLLRHTVEMTTHGWATLTWPLFFRPLHDALIEDSLTTAERSLALPPHDKRWSLWVRCLRWIATAGASAARTEV